MLLLLGIALPLAILGFGMDSGDDEETLDEVTLEGTEEADRLEGDQGRDFIDGLEGDDVMNGRAGDDIIFGREGEDVLQGEDGDDMLCSGDGDDIVTGNRGQDLIEGQEGDDFVSGDYGWDTVRGDEGDDTVLGGRGFDIVGGGFGDDLVFGGIIQGVPLNLEELTELRDGGSLADINGGINMRDDSLGNELYGGFGDDNLVLGSGDIADGNEGDDTFHVMSEQIGENGAAVINNYSVSEDAITIIVDDVDAAAEITVADENGNSVISLNGVRLAVVDGTAGTIAASDVSLISENVVESLFDPNGAAA
ncbi:calcium-binding protein [uncultured Sulfitobacter sp.]|uniref:calcium-binding protein n=1 Tax=uncultured Sulfitobacter sp. TaxID=191468 RepID=UPI002635478F|nr:calcium-binding protein [uncultured Sulfitobacter sp.]